MNEDKRDNMDQVLLVLSKRMKEACLFGTNSFIWKREVVYSSLIDFIIICLLVRASCSIWVAVAIIHIRFVGLLTTGNDKKMFILLIKSISIFRSKADSKPEWQKGAKRIESRKISSSIDFRSVFLFLLFATAKVSRSGIDPPYLPRSAVAACTYLLFTFHVCTGQFLPLCKS